MEEQNLRFSSDHVWVRIEEENTALIGITEEPLANVQNFDRIKFPQEGVEVSKDEVFGYIMEDKKSLFTLISPLTGEILSVNEDIEDAPEVLLEDNYEEGWLIRLLIQDPDELEDLMTRQEYEHYVSEAEEEDEDEDEEDEDDFLEEDEDDEDEDEDEDDDDEDDYYDDDDDDY
ncbi:MAG: glycine cleavage system protein H [Deltaproteobacteria bacterium]|nr:glycine cleavage system protein H [Deltaproteobacteria bacterium]